MPHQNHKTWLEISKSALENNLRVIRGLLANGVKLMAVVKSNAYGHGLIETARIFSGGADWLGVDNMGEALELRKAGLGLPILVLGHTRPQNFQEARDNNISLVFYNPEFLDGLNGQSPKLHIKVETGMSRQGVALADLNDFLKKIKRPELIEGVLSHYADADNTGDKSYSLAQLESFGKALEILKTNGFEPGLVHMAHTHGLLALPEKQYDMVRVGIGLYGLWPSVEVGENFKDLKIIPALSFKTRVVQVKDIAKGAGIGYGLTERAAEDLRVAVLPVGYYDGYDRGLSSVGEVLIGGKRCRILGRVSMNLAVANVSKVQSADLDSEAVLIGSQGSETISAEELAEKLHTISYEVVSRINPFLPRVYVE